MELFNNTYSAHEVALAANVTPATLQNWLKRGVAVGHPDAPIEGGGLQGKHRHFSFPATMQISVANALVQVGVTDLKSAFKAAQVFAHSDEDLTHLQSQRLPGLPFHYDAGVTFAYVAGEKCTVAVDGNIHSVLNRLGKPTGCIILNVSAVFNATVGRMGLSHTSILDAAYKGTKS